MIPNTTDKTTDGMLPAPACSPSSTPETDARSIDDQWMECEGLQTSVDADFARRLERERNNAISALETIGKIYMDGCDTYEDWMAMGKLARAALSKENV